MPDDHERPHTEDPAATAQAWVVRLASGDMSERELVELRAWLAADARHRAAFEDARQAWRAAGAIPEAFETGAHAARDRRTERAKSGTRRGRVWAAGAAAVAVAAIAYFGDVWTKVQADHTTAVGEQAEITLPDGSTAHLNTDTAITVSYSEGRRRVDLLRGEAFFEVRTAADRPFRVRFDGAAATAVGTAYAVRHGEAQSSVAVVDGGVAVEMPSTEGERNLLNAGERLVHRGERDTVTIESVEPERVTAWRRGRIVIDSVSLARAVSELDRYRPGHIVVLDGSRADEPVSGVFGLDRIDSAVTALAATRGMSVTRITDRLLIVH